MRLNFSRALKTGIPAMRTFFLVFSLSLTFHALVLRCRILHRTKAFIRKTFRLWVTIGACPVSGVTAAAVLVLYWGC